MYNIIFSSASLLALSPTNLNFPILGEEKKTLISGEKKKKKKKP